MRAVETEQLVVEYARDGVKKTALSDISLEIGQGEVRGFLGPNGAGKTTLCRVLSTVISPSSGTVKVMGKDVLAQGQDVRRTIGLCLGGERGLYTRLTGKQNLEYWASLYGLSRRQTQETISLLMQRTGLGRRSDDKVETYSRGMKQRLHLARALVGDPRVLVLDEPTVGLDPAAAHEFRRLVKEQVRDGVTVVLTTHDMREAESLCDRITLLDAGTIVQTATPAQLKEWSEAFGRVEARAVTRAARDRVGKIHGVASLEEEDDRVLITFSNASAAEEAMVTLVRNGARNVQSHEATLEDVYLKLFGSRGLEA